MQLLPARPLRMEQLPRLGRVTYWAAPQLQTGQWGGGNVFYTLSFTSHPPSVKSAIVSRWNEGHTPPRQLQKITSFPGIVKNISPQDLGVNTSELHLGQL